MARLLKLALYVLALVAVVDVARYRRRELERRTRKDALMTWEDEGGAVHASR